MGNGRAVTDSEGAAPWSHHAAFVNGQRIHYVRAGEGEPLVLLHGWPQTWYQWRKVIPALAEHYTVIAPDLRGFGESSKPLDGYDKKTVAEDIFQLTEQLGFEFVGLVGHDLGGPTAYAFAKAHPEHVRKLALLDIEITIDREDGRRLLHAAVSPFFQRRARYRGRAGVRAGADVFDPLLPQLLQPGRVQPCRYRRICGGLFGARGNAGQHGPLRGDLDGPGTQHREREGAARNARARTRRGDEFRARSQ